MRVLVVGGGGREHAIVRALATGSEAPEILAAPGNPGIGGMARSIPVAADDIDGILGAARAEAVDLVIPGPELPLTLGLTDALEAEGIACCGPSAAAARLEGSKAFTRRVCRQAGVPAPRFAVVDDPDHLEGALDEVGGIPVIKADGLAAGKGVFLPDDLEGCRRAAADLLLGSMGEAGRVVVIEERLEGTEASLFFAVDGMDVAILPHARDHKRLLDGDRGPNTGGMGSVSPNPDLRGDLVAEATDRVVVPILEHLVRMGHRYRGFLYAGLMLTASGMRLLEINVRLGDPEAQTVLPRLEAGVFAEVTRRVVTGRLADFRLPQEGEPTCTVVAAAAGYPDRPRRDDPIHIGSGVEGGDRWIDHAGTARRDGTLVTAGGRVLAVTARAPDAAAARRAAYQGITGIRWNGMQYRSDIGGSEEGT